MGMGMRIRIPKTGEDLYSTVQQPAEAIKGYVQIGIGIAVLIIFGLQWYSQRAQFNIPHKALAFVGYGLAVSAAVELAYTFFTKGPDEALDPLILGVSSFALISLSEIDKPTLTLANAIPASLFALTILLLFFARRFLLEVEESPEAGPSEAQLAAQLGHSVRERRIALGLSQEELATRAGMTRRAVARVEKGHTVPTVPMLARFSTALNAELIIEIAPLAG
jgi:DNA-binding XRE family transcriptional regulator